MGIDPRSIPGLQLWVRAAWTYHVDGGTVSHWFDESGKGKHLFMPTGALQPLRKYNRWSPHGVDSVNFDGSDVMRVNGQPIPTGGNMTAVVVARLEKPAGVFVFDTGNDSAVSRHFVQMHTTGVIVGRDGGGGSVTNASYTNGNWGVFVGTMNGASSVAVVNGSNDITGSISTDGTPPATDMRVGSRYTEDAAWLNTDLTELLLYSPRIDTSQRKALEQMLGRRYGVPIGAS
jgi:hypothetical protein